MNRNEILSRLRSQGTGRLILLTILSLGVYEAYYLKRQTKILNEYLEPGNVISETLVRTIIILTWISILLFVPYLVVDEKHTVASISTFVDRLWIVLIAIWCFKVRNRIHSLLQISKGDLSWLKWHWTLGFNAFYINYKINQIHEGLPNQSVQADADKAGAADA